MSDFKPPAIWTSKADWENSSAKEEYLRANMKKPDWVCNLEDEVGELRNMISNITTLKKYSQYLLLVDPCEAPPEADLLALVPYDEPYSGQESLPLLAPLNPQMGYQQQYPMTGSKTIMQRKNKFLFGIPLSDGELSTLRKQITELIESKNLLSKGHDLNLAELTKEKKINKELLEETAKLMDEVAFFKNQSKENAVLAADHFCQMKALQQKLEQYEAQALSPLIQTPVMAVELEEEKQEPVLSEDELQQLGEMVEKAEKERLSDREKLSQDVW